MPTVERLSCLSEIYAVRVRGARPLSSVIRVRPDDLESYASRTVSYVIGSY